MLIYGEGELLSLFSAILVAASLITCSSGGSNESAELFDLVTDSLPSFYKKEPVNLIVISIDTFRRDVLARYGGVSGSAEYLSQLFDEGYALEQHTSCSNWTMQSMLCLQTGASNLDVGVVPDVSSVHRAAIPDSLTTLPVVLADAGYHSVLATGNSWFSSVWNMDLGFSWSSTPIHGNVEKVYENGLEPLMAAREKGLTDPFYLHLHIIEPHAAYDPPDKYLDGLDALEEIDIDLSQKDEQYAKNREWMTMPVEEQELYNNHLKVRYAGEVEFLDDQLRSVMEDLENRNFLKNTLVVIVSDHGEAFFEHGEQNHAVSLHREENDAIALFWAQNIVPGSFDGPTTHADIAPTILSVLGVEQPKTMTGLTVAEVSYDRTRFAITAGKLGVRQSVMDGGHKLIFDWSTGRIETYDLAADPLEQTDLVSYDATEAARLFEILRPEVERASEIMSHYLVSEPVYQ
jgi:arylsulfatase A-like enzyme